jgi:hypothetical protein
VRALASIPAGTHTHRGGTRGGVDVRAPRAPVSRRPMGRDAAAHLVRFAGHGPQGHVVARHPVPHRVLASGIERGRQQGALSNDTYSGIPISRGPRGTFAPFKRGGGLNGASRQKNKELPRVKRRGGRGGAYPQEIGTQRPGSDRAGPGGNKRRDGLKRALAQKKGRPQVGLAQKSGSDWGPNRASHAPAFRTSPDASARS